MAQKPDTPNTQRESVITVLSPEGAPETDSGALLFSAGAAGVDVIDWSPLARAMQKTPTRTLMPTAVNRVPQTPSQAMSKNPQRMAPAAAPMVLMPWSRPFKAFVLR
jgi:hypothetical protein